MREGELEERVHPVSKREGSIECTRVGGGYGGDADLDNLGGYNDEGRERRGTPKRSETVESESR